MGAKWSMRALILSDIHGNLEALTAVLAASGEYDQLWNLGDVVGYGGSPNQVIDVVEPLAQVNVRGNHDRVCCGEASAMGFNPAARAAALWTLRELTPAHIDWLRQMPRGPIIPHQNGSAKASQLDLSCVHGSPLNEDHYILNMRDAWAPLQQMIAHITFFGHTHVQGGFSPECQSMERDTAHLPLQEEGGKLDDGHACGNASPGQPWFGRSTARQRLARCLRSV